MQKCPAVCKAKDQVATIGRVTMVSSPSCLLIAFLDHRTRIGTLCQVSFPRIRFMGENAEPMIASSTLSAAKSDENLQFKYIIQKLEA